jgi:hypothetical protein
MPSRSPRKQRNLEPGDFLAPRSAVATAAGGRVTAIAYSRGRDNHDACPDQRKAANFAEFASTVLADRSQRKGLAYVSAPFARNGDGRHQLKYAAPTAAGAEVHARAERHVAANGGTYQDAVRAVLKADPELATAYAQPASRMATMATKPAVPVAGGEEREILDWLLRALKDDMTGALPGALGLLGIEADKLKRIGMPIEEAARRAMDSNPHLGSMAKLLIGDARRNAPGNKPVPADKANALAQGDARRDRGP